MVGISASLSEHGYHLSKSEFRDAICLRYSWSLDRLPARCVCGAGFTIEHALSCPCGGYPSLRHNEVRDLLAGLMSEVCKDVTTEPQLEPLSGETFRCNSTTTDDQARVDIRARGFWGGHFEVAFFDVRVLNPLAASNYTNTLASCYQRHERSKQRMYEERIREVDHGSFTPLVFSASGGARQLAERMIKRLSSELSEKLDVPYSRTIHWVRLRLCFALLRASIMCLRGTRHRYFGSSDISPLVALSEGRVL